MLANDVTIQQGHRPASRLEQFDSQHIGNGGFSCTREAGEKNREPLEMTRWVAKPQFGGNFRKREPRGEITSFSEAVAQIGARDVEGARPLRHFVLGNIGVAFRQVNHHVKRDYGDAEFLPVGPQQVLGSVRAVKGFTSSVATRPSMVAAHNKVATSIVLSN